MICYLTYLRDIIGNNYLGINIGNGIIQPYLNKLKEILGEDNYNLFTKNQQDRDQGDYHITVMNVADYNKLSNQHKIDRFVRSLDPVLKFEIDDIQLLGLGTAERNNNRAYFVVVRSEQLQSIRQRYYLPPIDLHITIGFNPRDVFGVRKNQVMENFNPFLKLLAIEYYKNENFNFIKDIENFNEDLDSEIIPVKIYDSHLKVQCGDCYMDIGWLDDSKKFWIMTKYKSDEKLPRLSQNEISKILK